MNKRKLIIIFSLAVSAVALARPDATADFKKFLMSEGQKSMKAFADKNIKYFETMSTADFTMTERGQKMDKKSSMAGLKQWFGMMKSIKASFKLTSAKSDGKTGVATMTSTMVGWTKPTANDKKSHKMEMTGYEKQTWVKKGSSWKLKSIEEAKPGKMTMDGKPFDPSMMGGG